MNVSQLSGDNANPSIWQPFVAVAALNVLFVTALAVTNWVQIQMHHHRTAGVKEVFGYAVGSVGSDSTL